MPMKLIHQFKGSLPKDFVGQIAYVFCLPNKLKALDIEFSFQKRKLSAEDDTPSLRKELKTYCQHQYDKDLSPQEIEDLLSQMKTELHTLAELNGEFIGGIHRQEEVRHMTFSSTEASLGCIPIKGIQGSLKVTILSFNVLLDETPYELNIYGQED